jgi:cytochrome c556
MQTNDPKMILAAVSVFVATAATTAWAHKGATGVVKDRMTAMKSMADGMKPLSRMVTGKEAYSSARAKDIGKTIKQHAADIEGLFPKGSISGPSEALPAIWQNWDEFLGSARKLEKLAADLEAAADQGQKAALPIFAQMGKTCSGCHEDFRKKKE